MVKMKQPEMVDLGLSIKWAKWNVGASEETEYGKLFAFGDIVGTEATGDDCVGKYDEIWYNKQGLAAINSDLGLKQDVANVVYGGNYRMPTKEECEELIRNTIYSYTTMVNGIKGAKFTAKNGNYIFFPFASYGYNGSIYLSNNSCSIWTSSCGKDNGAWYLYCDDYHYGVYDDFRHIGFSVRAVCK